MAKPRSMFRRGWEVFAENKLALVGLGFVIFILLFSFVGPLIYKTQQVSVPLAGRLLHAERASTCSAATTSATTSSAGSWSAGRTRWRSAWPPRSCRACSAPSTAPSPGSPGGVVDSFMMRIVDAMLSIPFIFVLIILAVLIHPSR